MLAEVHSAKSLQSRILLPPDAFYYLHPVQVGLLEEPMKLEVITSAETHAQLNKLVNCNALFFVFPVMFRVVALDFNFKPVQEMVGDLNIPLYLNGEIKGKICTMNVYLIRGITNSTYSMLLDSTKSSMIGIFPSIFISSVFFM